MGEKIGVWTKVLDAISDTLKYFVCPPEAPPKDGNHS